MAGLFLCPHQAPPLRFTFIRNADSRITNRAPPHLRMRHMGTRTVLRLNHEHRILNSGARLHGAETTPLVDTQHIPLHLYCYSHARSSALHRNMHCGAMADAARCADRCSALRRPMQRTAFFATIRPPFRPTPFHQSKDCSPPILRNAQQALHQTDSDAPDTAF